MKFRFACVLVLFLLSSLPAQWLRSKGVSTRNLLGLEHTRPFSLPKRSAAMQGTPDTIHVVAFRVSFNPDSTVLTTGTGEFGSDTAYYSTYKYDRSPHDKMYFEKHLEFLANYYHKVSDGHLVIVPHVYPTDSRGESPTYQVTNGEMRDYSPWEQRSDESHCDFGMRRATAMMRFVEDAVEAADNNASLGNPFLDASQNYDPAKTVYLLIHAGASAFADGGYYQSLGDMAKNTPADFFDFFVSQQDIRYFRKKDYFEVAGGTIRIQDLMMVSETANQDSLNWGVNGILVNQFARQLGAPDLFGVSNCIGISAIGSFCIMDFAGYNNGDGFIPPYPSAWIRAFLGWTQPVICRPGQDSTYRVFAASLDTTAEILQVPLNENEYLLIENRQRALPGRPWFRRDTLTDGHVVSGMAIVDSLVITDTSRTDIVVDARDFESGLPGSGVLVWHVDESMIRNLYSFNAVNFDSSRRAIHLLEADGVQDIGVQYANVFGTPLQDYGQANDFFPHVDLTRPGTVVNSLTDIRTRDGAFALVEIHAITPGSTGRDTLYAQGHGNEEGRRIANFRSEYFDLDIRWNRSQGKWPAIADSGITPNHLLSVNLVDSSSGKEVVAMSTTGKIYVTTSSGLSVSAFSDSLPVLNAKGDTLRWDARNYLVDLNDALMTPAALADTVWVAGNRNLYRLYGTTADTLVLDSFSIGFTPTIGPVFAGDTLYLGDSNGQVRAYRNGALLYMLDADTSPVTAIAVADLDGDGARELVAGLANGGLHCFQGQTEEWDTTLSHMQDPLVAIGDIDNSRDGHKEIVVVGSVDTVGVSVRVDSGWLDTTSWVTVLGGDGRTFGAAHAWPVAIKRYSRSAPALGDLDGDGYLDVVLAGSERVFALDRNGNSLPHYPLLLDNQIGSQVEVLCSPTLASVDAQATPEIILGYGFKDYMTVVYDTALMADSILDGRYAFGQITALTRNGTIPLDWPFSTSTHVRSSVIVEDMDGDGTMELLAPSAGGWIYAWEIPATRGDSGRVFWPAGNGKLRNPVFPDSLLPAPPVAVTDPLNIQAFYCYPNPVVSRDLVTLRYQLNRDATKSELVLYDPNNRHKESKDGLPTAGSWNRYQLDISGYPSGVYRAKLVAEQGDVRQVRFCKIAVVR